MDLYSQVIHKTRYARYIESESRRESQEDTWDRYLDYFCHVHPSLNSVKSFLKQQMMAQSSVPSMRATMTAGPALERDLVAGYNCSYTIVDSPRAFDETMYLLMCGVGCGFSVERNYVRKLPEVADKFFACDTEIVVDDSRIGWAKAYKQLLALLWNGDIPKWNLSKLREAGAPLKTFGGRASGPEPLNELFEFAVRLFQNARGRQLNSLECHDLMCKTAEIVVVGGVRRSALISLSNLSDSRLRDCKKDLWTQNSRGEWVCKEPQRALSNNSVAYTEKPDPVAFLNEWTTLVSSGNGERGIFNRAGAKAHVQKYGTRDPNYDFGANPCCEILLRPNQFCNLSEAVIRETDRFGSKELDDKVRAAAIFGTAQAALTNFRYIRRTWKKNSEEEALLGVSLTGWMDNLLFSTPTPELGAELRRLQDLVAETNREWAAKLGIQPATSITCVKPSGTVSQLVDCASGVHSRHAPYYIRRIRQDIKDPMNAAMQAAGIPWEPDSSKPLDQLVFEFPRKAPAGAVTRDARSAIEQLDFWLFIKRNWATHTVSNTVYYKQEEAVEVGAWVYRNFDEITGLSFLPYDGGIYPQAPYEDIDEVEYLKRKAAMPSEINWDISESEDNTTGSHTLACVGGSCEI